MNFVFEIEIFGKTMKADIIAPNEAEARDILFREVKKQVKIKSIIPAEIDRGAKKVEGIFKKLGITK